MSQATVHQDPEPAGRPTRLYPAPLRDLIEVERERLAGLVEADDPTSAYVAELLAAAPPLSAELRAQLAGLLNSE